MAVYAIGDVHGQLAMLERALTLIEADGGPDARVVFVGDYTDRGPESRAVLDLLIGAKEAGRNWVMLKGNHDRMFYRFVTEGVVHDAAITSGRTWLDPRLGGFVTLSTYMDVQGFLDRVGGGMEAVASYGRAPEQDARLKALVDEARLAVPPAHMEFIETLPLTHAEDGLLFVHAGLRPGVALEDQIEDDLIWIRDPWLNDPRDHGARVVHGHTALEHPTNHSNRVNIDGGAGYGRPLVPLVFEDNRCWTLSETGRTELFPS